MHLKILVPSEIFADQDRRVEALWPRPVRDRSDLLPHRLDCVAALVPGILTYQTKEGKTVYLAVDEGVLVKAGADVLVSVRHAIGGTDLTGLHDAVKREFLTFDEQEKSVRSAVAKMESGFIGRFAEFQRKNGHR